MFTGMSQQEFADTLGVTFATVNRWENGKAIPNRLAQSGLYDLCREKDIPVYDMTLERIREEARSAEKEGRLLLDHGSKSGIKGAIAPISREKCDFGAGFYMGTEPMQPLTLVCDFDAPKFCIVSIDMKDLAVLEIPAELDWAMLVAYNRGKMDEIRGTELYEKYRHMCDRSDVVVGCITDDRMFYVLDNFFLGKHYGQGADPKPFRAEDRQAVRGRYAKGL